MLLFLLICLHVCRCFWFCRRNCCCSFFILLMFLISVIFFYTARVLANFLHCCCCFCSSSLFLALLLDLEAPLLFLLSLLLTLAPHLLLFMSLPLALQAPLLLLLFSLLPFSPLLLALLAPLLEDFCPGCATVVAIAVPVFLFPAQLKAITQLMLADVGDNGPALIEAFSQTSPIIMLLVTIYQCRPTHLE